MEKKWVGGLLFGEFGAILTYQVGEWAAGRSGLGACQAGFSRVSSRRGRGPEMFGQFFIFFAESCLTGVFWWYILLGSNQLALVG